MEKVTISIFVLTTIEFVDGVEQHNKPIISKTAEEGEKLMNEKADAWIKMFSEIDDFKPDTKRLCDEVKVNDLNEPGTFIHIYMDEMPLGISVG